MISNLTENQWIYASTLMRALAESGRLPTLSAAQHEVLYNEFATWSEINFQVYGHYDLHDEQIQSLLDTADTSSDSIQDDSMLSVIAESELVNLGVSVTGDMVLRLSEVSAN